VRSSHRQERESKSRRNLRPGLTFLGGGRKREKGDGGFRKVELEGARRGGHEGKKVRRGR